MLVEWWSQRR